MVVFDVVAYTTPLAVNAEAPLNRVPPGDDCCSTPSIFWTTPSV
jgi:hypothetical protein